MDTTRLGEVAAALMERLADEAEETEDKSELGEVMILAEVCGVDEKGGYTYIAYRCSDPRNWIQRGMLHAAIDGDTTVNSSGEDVEDDEGEGGDTE